MSSKSPISRFENFARELVEGSFDRLLGQPGPLFEVASALSKAAGDSQYNGLAADLYTVRVNPTTLVTLESQSQDNAAVLEAMLGQLGERERLVFAGDVKVAFVADTKIELGRAIVSAKRSSGNEEPTAVLRSKKPQTAPLRRMEAYLIVNGRRHVALEKAVSSIGRSLDNEIVIEDPGVSRVHAQIRWRRGRFVIFDLGSRSGTSVNGRRRDEVELSSGDVITLGSAALIYGEEDPAADGQHSSPGASNDVTQELRPEDPL
jgi:hypothetical protein